MMKPAKIVLAVWILMFTGACEISQIKNEAQTVADEFYATLQTGDLDRLMTFYAQKFFESHPKAEWKQTLQGNRDALGRYQGHELNSWRIDEQASQKDGSTRIVLFCVVRYEKGQTQETLSLLRPPEGGRYALIGHHISK